MKPVWLIERGVYGQQAQAFMSEVHSQGMDCAEVDYRPGRPPPDDIVGCKPLADNACVVLWGTLPLMQQIHLHRSWVPGGWCNIENLDCSRYYRFFKGFLLNRDYSTLPGEIATDLQDQLFAEFGRDDEMFVRPNGVHKLFTGRVIYKDDFRDAIAPARYDSATLIVVSTPKEVGREWRIVIVNEQIVASSQYRDNGAIRISRGCPDRVSQFVQAVLRDVSWRPDTAFMLDVCESDNELRVMELNSFSCSALYECDLSAVIRAASAAAENEWKDRHNG